MKLYATTAEYWKGHWSSGTLSADYPYPVWTVSTLPDAPGWNTDGGTSGYGIGEEHARLMSAAPEMLAALEALVFNYENGNAHNWDGYELPAIRAAIAKALNK